MWNPFRRRQLGPADLSDNLRAIIARSREEAIRLDNDFVHPVHLLLAVLADESSSLYRVLQATGTELAALRRDLENSLKGRRTTQRGVTVRGSLPLTTELEDALRRAFRLSFALGARQVEAAHLALGMLEAPESSGAGVLRGLGIEAADLAGAASAGS
ncbi:Clp protease N-terminal domain-containing protein [Hymenobacter edaphi]|uniref:Clp R domain-containing protein n=1 Tax=Hymenobacter edaphi TaxID=2211146 RepID=A0A328BDA1_9BACT|nr:Clp protease N-terminal domain-containing protein [Hymenobacter edaphi]RAK63826.1 hypothetical protein DLM85_19950 [Hymenobacter edaphi]